MVVSIERIARLPEVRSPIVAGAQGAEREIRWVHVSEVEDPTPWLQGGELLLTTGLRLHGGDELAAYVRRLSDAGIAGIGFGIGLEHEKVPDEMVREADELGIPLLEIPVDVPYISISEAVSNMLAAERYEAITQAFEAQQALTRAALAGSGETLVHEISRQLRGWAVSTDGSGRPTAAWPSGAAAKVSELLPDLMRARHQASPTATAIVADGASTVIHSLTTDGLPRGFLIAGVDRSMGTFERLVLQAAVSLLTLESERTRVLNSRLRRLQADALRQLLRSRKPPFDAGRQIAGWNLDPLELRVAVVAVPNDAVPTALDGLFGALADQELPGVACQVSSDSRGAQLALLVGSDLDLDRLLDAAGLPGSTVIGIGEAVAVDELHRGYRTAVNAASIGRLERRRTTRFDELPALQLLLRGEESATVRSFATRVLGPLAAPVTDAKSIELRRTLDAFLSANGHWNEAAASLGVHRHTLKARIGRIHELTGRDPDSAYSRMELWLAVVAEGAIESDG